MNFSKFQPSSQRLAPRSGRQDRRSFVRFDWDRLAALKRKGEKLNVEKQNCRDVWNYSCHRLLAITDSNKKTVAWLSQLLNSHKHDCHGTPFSSNVWHHDCEIHTLTAWRLSESEKQEKLEDYESPLIKGNRHDGMCVMLKAAGYT